MLYYRIKWISALQEKRGPKQIRFLACLHSGCRPSRSARGVAGTPSSSSGRKWPTESPALSLGRLGDHGFRSNTFVLFSFSKNSSLNRKIPSLRKIFPRYLFCLQVLWYLVFPVAFPSRGGHLTDTESSVGCLWICALLVRSHWASDLAAALLVSISSLTNWGDNTQRVTVRIQHRRVSRSLETEPGSCYY